MARPTFFDYRWAACATPNCDAFGKDKRVQQPMRQERCPRCNAHSYRTKRWRGWAAARTARSQLKSLERAAGIFVR